MSLESFPQRVPAPFGALAFDYGTRNIGVAFGQSISGTAQALPTIKARDGVPDWKDIAELINRWQPTLLVVGIPLHLDGSSSEMTTRARKFANRLNGRFHLPCFGMDERLSSLAAEELLRTRGSAADPDSVAAQLILESWFSELASRPPAA
jgi:putative holliday junction resolvase